MLVWSGLGHSTAQWQQRHAVLHRGSLHLLQSQDADAAAVSWSLRSDRCCCSHDLLSADLVLPVDSSQL